MELQTPTLSPPPPRAATARGAIGVVAIGRNEGERLRKCLASALPSAAAVVYVDSGSSDGSISVAQELGAEVVVLDMSLPFTAARARNEGFDHLMSIAPMLDFVQFVDGDCELVPGWMESAEATLQDRPELGVACGRRRERFPEASIYNRLCDLEWGMPPGETTWCGGDSLMRVRAFVQAGKFNPRLIAGEEPELCVRLRQCGWTIYRLDAEMTLHDAAMMRFGQWWKRNVRAGHAFAEGAWMHGSLPEKYCVRETASGIVWGLLLPLIALATAWPLPWAGLALFLLYPMLGAKVFVGGVRRGMPVILAARYAFFNVIGKFALATGQIKFAVTRALGRRSGLIEYKK